ncbi:MAG: hypothetical protein H0U13_04580 [Gemmatimonadaceae bacterium]|nr:hypothetical protein [Gemmatimonadaceae bacterium]
MAATTFDQYGAPSYGALGKPPAGVVFHTPENADATLASAIAIAKWQAGSTNTSGGSYHGILGHDYAHAIPGCTVADHWTMVRSVPWNMAAGGLSGNHTSPANGGAWDPGRYPWIAQLLGAAAYADPNRWLHQISLSGKAAWYVTNGYPPGALKRLAEWVLILEKAYGYDAVMTLHRMWQTNRSDPGPLDLGAKVMIEYNKLIAPTPAPAPVPAPTPVPAPAPAPAPAPVPVVKTYTQVQLDAIVATAKTTATASGRAAGIKAAATAAAAAK